MKNTLGQLMMLVLIVALNWGAYQWLKSDRPKTPATIEGFLLLENESGKHVEYSLGMSRTMSDCRGMGNVETGPDEDGYWVDPTFSQIGQETDGWTYFSVAGFVCRPSPVSAQP